jgi:hypothetical protein
LTRRGADALVRLERLMDEATRALAAGTVPRRAGAEGTTGRGAIASVTDPTGQNPSD